MKPTITLFSLVLFVLTGCNDVTQDTDATDLPLETSTLADGQKVEIKGVAANLPDHTEKSMGHGITSTQGEFLFDGEFESFPAEIIGSPIRVTGVVREKHYPMFEHANDGSPAPQGIPVPEGTDLPTASLYYVIENPIWELDD